jgi:hypothetical protein
MGVIIINWIVASGNAGCLLYLGAGVEVKGERQALYYDSVHGGIQWSDSTTNFSHFVEYNSWLQLINTSLYLRAASTNDGTA